MPACSTSTPSSTRSSKAGDRPSTGSCSGDETPTCYAEEGVEPQPWEPDEGATAAINYTSGTTARPKGVQITHRNIWVNAVTFAMHTTVSDRDVYLHTLPMFHANGWGMPFAMTGPRGQAGRDPQDRRGRDPAAGRAEHGVTVLCAAPAVAAAVLEAAQTWEGEIPGRDRVRIIMAGAPPPTKTVARVESELGWEFIQIYGLTETSPLLTINRTRAEWDDLLGRGAGLQADPGRRARARRTAQGASGAGSRRRAPVSCWRAPTWCSRATGSSRRRRRRRCGTAGSTPATAR